MSQHLAQGTFGGMLDMSGSQTLQGECGRVLDSMGQRREAGLHSI